MKKLTLKRLRRSLNKFYGGCAGGGGNCSMISDYKECCVAIIKEIEWEMRPGGMIVQKRDVDTEDQETEKEEGSIMVSVASTAGAAGSQCCDVSNQATSTFGELKMIMLSEMSGMDGPQDEQRPVLFKGKEKREDDMEHHGLHNMVVGVIDKGKVDAVMLEDHPAIKETKVHGDISLVN